jgi:predicted PurR-regulated permease PerM
MTSEQTARRFFFLLLLIATVLLALVVQPLGAALFMAAVMAGVLWPVYARLTRWLRGRRSLAAGSLTLAVVVVLVGPVIGLSASIVAEATDGLHFLSRTVRSEGVTGLVQRLPPVLQRVAAEVLQRVPQEDGQGLNQVVQKQVSAQGGKAAVAVAAAARATGSLLFQVVMMLIAFFFLLTEGSQLVAWLDDMSPLRPGQTRELMSEFKRTSYAVIVSTVLTAGVQAIAALIGYFIAHVPNPIFFAGVTFFVAFIPSIGAGAVCLAAAAILAVTGHPYMGLFLALWGLVVVGLVDNIVKPLLIKGGMEMNGAVVFFALIGGLAAFGTVGLLLGPLVVAFFLALLRMWQRDFKPKAGPDGGAGPVVLAP